MDGLNTSCQVHPCPLRTSNVRITTAKKNNCDHKKELSTCDCKLKNIFVIVVSMFGVLIIS
jgi:hypothetical protein